MEILVFYDLIRGPEIQIPSQFSGPMALIGEKSLSTNNVFFIASKKSAFDKQHNV